MLMNCGKGEFLLTEHALLMQNANYVNSNFFVITKAFHISSP